MNNSTKDKAVMVIDWAAFFFFAVLVFFMPISSAGVEICFGFLMLTFIIKGLVVRPGRRVIKGFFAERLNLALLIFYLALLLSLLVSSNPVKSLEAWFFKWGEGVLIFYFAQVFLKPRQVKILLLLFLAVSFLIAIDGLYQGQTGRDFIRGFEINTNVYRAGSAKTFTAIRATFNHYNNYGSFLLIPICLAAGALAAARKFPLKLAALAVLVLATLNLFYTYSRGAWLGLAFACCLAAFFVKGKKTRLGIFSFLGAFFLGALTVPGIRERLLSLFQPGADAQRFQLWGAALTMFKESPLVGKGLGLFMEQLPLYLPGQHQYAHNCYLQILAETGLVGLLSFFWFLGQVLRFSYKEIKAKADPLFMGLAAGLAGFLVHCFFDNQLFSFKLLTTFWIVVAFIAVYPAKTSSTPNSTPSSAHG